MGGYDSSTGQDKACCGVCRIIADVVTAEYFDLYQFHALLQCSDCSFVGTLLTLSDHSSQEESCIPGKIPEPAVHENDEDSEEDWDSDEDDDDWSKGPESELIVGDRCNWRTCRLCKMIEFEERHSKSRKRYGGWKNLPFP